MIDGENRSVKVAEEMEAVGALGDKPIDSLLRMRELSKPYQEYQNSVCCN